MEKQTKKTYTKPVKSKKSLSSNPIEKIEQLEKNKTISSGFGAHKNNPYAQTSFTTKKENPFAVNGNFDSIVETINNFNITKTKSKAFVPLKEESVNTEETAQNVEVKSDEEVNIEEIPVSEEITEESSDSEAEDDSSEELEEVKDNQSNNNITVDYNGNKRKNKKHRN